MVRAVYFVRRQILCLTLMLGTALRANTTDDPSSLHNKLIQLTQHVVVFIEIHFPCCEPLAARKAFAAPPD